MKNLYGGITMKMNLKKSHLRFLGLILLSVLVISATAFASTLRALRWSHLIAMSGNMSVNDSGIATITAECRADYMTVDQVKLKCELQQLDNSWKTIKTWTETANKNSIIYEKEYAIYKNYSYRLKITSYVYSNGTLLETATENFDYGYYK